MKYKIVKQKALLCDRCDTWLGNLDGWGYYGDDNNNFYCPDCALWLGLIDAMEWLNENGICFYDHAEYKDGVITAYEKYGRGYHKDVVRIFDENGCRVKGETVQEESG